MCLIYLFTVVFAVWQVIQLSLDPALSGQSAEPIVYGRKSVIRPDQMVPGLILEVDFGLCVNLLCYSKY